jgi:transcriptional regulator with XRE-family HTH domain
MINAHRTGAYISRLRKAKDWTQLELAERLHVTHQAVSQWEKGASMPDISLLQPLAQLLGVTVDDLLNGEPVRPAASRVSRGAIVSELAQGHAGEAARLIKENPEGVDLMLETAPLARPSQIDEVVTHLAGFEFTLRQIVALAPFVSENVLQTLIDNATFDQIEAGDVVELAPFVGSETLDGLLPRVPASALGLNTLIELAPFAGDTALAARLLGLLQAGQAVASEQVAALAPFVNDRVLEALIVRLPDGSLPIEFVVELAPFASEAALDRLIERLEDRALLGHYLTELAPHLSQASLRRALSQMRGSLTAQQLVALAPFLDRETMEAVFRPGAARRED